MSNFFTTFVFLIVFAHTSLALESGLFRVSPESIERLKARGIPTSVSSFLEEQKSPQHLNKNELITLLTPIQSEVTSTIRRHILQQTFLISESGCPLYSDICECAPRLLECTLKDLVPSGRDFSFAPQRTLRYNVPFSALFSRLTDQLAFKYETSIPSIEKSEQCLGDVCETRYQQYMDYLSRSKVSLLINSTDAIFFDSLKSPHRWILKILNQQQLFVALAHEPIENVVEGAANPFDSVWVPPYSGGESVHFYLQEHLVSAYDLKLGDDIHSPLTGISFRKAEQLCFKTFSEEWGSLPQLYMFEHALRQKLIFGNPAVRYEMVALPRIDSTFATPFDIETFNFSRYLSDMLIFDWETKQYTQVSRLANPYGIGFRCMGEKR